MKNVSRRLYHIWWDMRLRATSKKYHKKYPTYKGCTMCKEWNNFDNFKEWALCNGYDDTKEIDKDILYPNNKHYSPEKCVFVSPKVNHLFTGTSISRTCYPIGVSFCKSRNKFRASLGVDGKVITLGRFNTIAEARQCYLISKISHIETLFDIVTKEVKQGLKRHIKLMKKELV